MRCSYRASGIRHQASGIRHQTSGIRHQASGIRHQASGIRHQASGTACRDKQCLSAGSPFAQSHQAPGTACSAGSLPAIPPSHPAVGAASGRQQAAPATPHAPTVGAALIRKDEQPGLRSKQSPGGRSSRVRCIDPVAASEPGWICLAANCVRAERRDAHPLRGKSVPYGGNGPADCRRYRLRGRQGAVPTGNADGRVPSLRTSRSLMPDA